MRDFILANDTTTTSEETAIITTLQEGYSDELFQKLITPHLQYGFRIIFRVVAHEQDAEDVLQEVLYKTIRSLNSFRFDASFRTWFSKICYNQAITYSMKWRKVSFQNVEDEIQQRDEEMIDIATITKIDNEKLWDGVNALHPRYRFVLLSFYQEGLKVKEIAELMGCAENAIKVVLHRARNVLKKEYCHAG